jgi:hypothetical protein
MRVSETATIEMSVAVTTEVSEAATREVEEPSIREEAVVEVSIKEVSVADTKEVSVADTLRVSELQQVSNNPIRHVDGSINPSPQQAALATCYDPSLEARWRHRGSVPSTEVLTLSIWRGVLAKLPLLPLIPIVHQLPLTPHALHVWVPRALAIVRARMPLPRSV